MEKPVKPRHLLMLILTALLGSACATTEPASAPEPGDELLSAPVVHLHLNGLNLPACAVVHLHEDPDVAVPTAPEIRGEEQHQEAELLVDDVGLEGEYHVVVEEKRDRPS